MYKFDFLFRGFFPLLTVRFLRAKNWITSFYWRTGIILQVSGCLQKKKEGKRKRESAFIIDLFFFQDKRPEKKDIRARMLLTDELQLTLSLRFVFGGFFVR